VGRAVHVGPHPAARIALLVERLEDAAITEAIVLVELGPPGAPTARATRRRSFPRRGNGSRRQADRFMAR